MPHRIRHLNHWRPPHDPWTYTGDGRYPERLTAADRRYFKHRVRRILRRIDGEEWPQAPDDDDH